MGGTGGESRLAAGARRQGQPPPACDAERRAGTRLCRRKSQASSESKVLTVPHRSRAGRVPKTPRLPPRSRSCAGIPECARTARCAPLSCTPGRPVAVPKSLCLNRARQERTRRSARGTQAQPREPAAPHSPRRFPVGGRRALQNDGRSMRARHARRCRGHVPRRARAADRTELGRCTVTRPRRRRPVRAASPCDAAPPLGGGSGSAPS